MRHGIGADRVCDLDLPLGDQRARDGCAEKIHAFIERVGAEHRKNIVAHEFLAQILDKDFLDPQKLGLGAGRFHLFTLAEIGCEGDDFGVIVVLQPAQNDRGVEPARIGKHDFFDVILFHGVSLSRSLAAPQRRFSASPALSGHR